MGPGRNDYCSNHMDTIERIVELEGEVKHMGKKLDAISEKLDQVSATVTRWTIALGIYGGLASLACVVALNWDKLKGLWS